jgi:aldehyde dehydrogenase (NAD+)
MEEDLKGLRAEQRAYFQAGHTKPVENRIEALKKLKTVLDRREQDVYDVLEADLSKSKFEAFLTEYYVIMDELKDYISKTKKWARPDKVLPAVANFPSTAKIHKEPYGNCLIISPWNYPFQLALGPLIGAVAAGNTVVLKPSEFSSATSQLLEEVISASFDRGHVSVVQGDAEVSKQLTSLPWDYIFFTGSPAVGKKVYQAAAEHLTPVTLELGGKNPCVVHESANVTVSARRIVWGKFINAGQTCIAPDYLLVHESIFDGLLAEMKNALLDFYGPDPKDSPDYPRIIRKEHLESLLGLLESADIIHGGEHDLDDLYLAPTLVANPDRDAAVMQDEIFGPILPIIKYSDKQEIADWINSYPKPLGGYCFCEDSAFAKWFTQEFSFGGGVINDSIVQFVNKRLPFGGVGNSGIGAYHGKRTFDTFSHQKSMVHRRTWLDLKVKYPPFEGKLKKVQKLLKWV